MNKNILGLLTAALLSSPMMAQTEVVAVDSTAAARMKSDLYFLASDAMKGRQPGRAEADVARNFIESRMIAYGIAPMGENGGYQQLFPVPEYAAVDSEKTELVLGKTAYKGHVDFYPTAQSSNGAVQGKTVYVQYGIEGEERNDYAGLNVDGKIAVMNVSSPDGVHPHSAFAAYHSVPERIKVAAGHGAAAVVLINPEETASDVVEFYKNIGDLGLPVVFVRNAELEQSLMGKSQKISLSVAQEEVHSDGYNVAGFIDNGAERTVILGAHYDHIGMGGENSLYKGPPAIHNGADDNASGTTLLLEMMRYYAAGNQKQYNYLILFFSAEEIGLVGSKYWAEHPTFDLEKCEYMINSDMVGRLRESRMQLSGTGTAKEWDKILEADLLGLSIKKDPAGVGPSDHTSFYYKKIPVLHLFTGTHDDYHKPADDADKILYDGMARQAAMVYSITLRTANYDGLTFQETSSSEQQSTPRFSVTLGVVPDYLFAGPGLRIDGATKGKPAAEGGLEAGDVILKIGEITIDDIYAYMRALGAFKKGDTTTLIYERDGEEITTEITF
jgi:hypothetical protein